MKRLLARADAPLPWMEALMDAFRRLLELWLSPPQLLRGSHGKSQTVAPKNSRKRSSMKTREHKKLHQNTWLCPLPSQALVERRGGGRGGGGGLSSTHRRGGEETCHEEHREILSAPSAAHLSAPIIGVRRTVCSASSRPCDMRVCGKGLL